MCYISFAVTDEEMTFIGNCVIHLLLMTSTVNVLLTCEPGPTQTLINARALWPSLCWQLFKESL